MSIHAYKIKGKSDEEEPIDDVVVLHNSISDVYCIKIGEQEVWLSGEELDRLAVLMLYDGWFAERFEKMRKLMDAEEYPYEILSARNIDSEHWEQLE